MKTIKRSTLMFLAFLLCPINVVAGSGMADSYMDGLLNLGAIDTIIILADILFLTSYHFGLKNTCYQERLKQMSWKLSSKKFGTMFIWGILFSFVVGPYLGILGFLTFGLTWVLLFCIFCFFFFQKKYREKMVSEKACMILLNLSLAQFFGLFIYAVVCNTSLIKNIFYYDWGEIPELGFYSYAGMDAYIYILSFMLLTLILLLIPVLILFLFNSFKLRRTECNGSSDNSCNRI